MQTQKTTILLVLMVGALLGRVVNLRDLGLMELTGLFMLAVCYHSEIWSGIKDLAKRPSVRIYARQRVTQVRAFAFSASWFQKLAFLAGIAFGGLLLVLDAMNRQRP